MSRSYLEVRKPSQSNWKERERGIFEVDLLNFVSWASKLVELSICLQSFG
jgi:hypothetical protein